MNTNKARFFCGLDLAAAAEGDYTAFCVIQPHQPEPKNKTWVCPSRYYGKRPEPPDDAKLPPLQFWLRHLERLKRGMSYPDQVKYIVSRINSPALAGKTELVIDATGVGRPVVDLFRAARVPGIIPISITGGLKASKDENGWNVPKRDLVIGAQVLLQSGRLKIADRLPLRDVFRNELLAFKTKIDPLTAHDSYNAGPSGAHDDCVLSVAIGLYRAHMLSQGMAMPIGGFKPSVRRFDSRDKGGD